MNIFLILYKDQKFLENLLGDDETVKQSFGIIEWDEIIVKEGPLKGLESRIIRVDRQKRLAYIELNMCDRTAEVQLFLNVIEKRP